MREARLGAPSAGSSSFILFILFILSSVLRFSF
jgi:hypothetical protein